MQELKRVVLYFFCFSSTWALGKKKGKAARGDPTAEELFNTIYKNERTAVAEEVNAWIEMYKRDQTKALTVLVSVLFRMCGCNTDLTAAQMEEEEVCVRCACLYICSCELGLLMLTNVARCLSYMRGLEHTSHARTPSKSKNNIHDLNVHVCRPTRWLRRRRRHTTGRARITRW